MNIQDFDKLGISNGDEIEVESVLGSEALTTIEFAKRFTDLLPNGSRKISVHNARQKLIRAEKKETVKRKKIHGLTYWVNIDEKEST